MADDLFSVKDQVVLVSGASRGIGRGLAEAFAARGATVLITGREKATLEKTAKEIAPAGAVVRAMVCDVSDAGAIERLVRDAVREFGRIDTLLNVAGVNRRMRAEKLTEDDYDFIVDINLKGPVLLSLAVGRHQLERKKGNQINITSLNNDRPLRGVMPYAVSKSGLQQMTRALAMEWGPGGIRVNAIAPGFILTDLTQKLWAQPVMKDWAMTNTPLRRLGVPDDLAGAALFLASDASAFMTGQTVYVDGGVSCGNAWPIPLE